MPNAKRACLSGFVRRFVPPTLRAVFFGLAPAVFAASIGASWGQQLPAALTPDQLQQLQQQYGTQSQSLSPGVNGVNQNPIILQPAVPPVQSADLQTSRLEQIFSARAGVSLKQFGYDQLGRASAVMVPQTGAVQDDYVLGPGDELIVDLRGQENSESRPVVDRNGQVTLPRLGPLSAAGRSFGNFRQDLQAAVGRAYVATTASVSVARMRQISVLVTGAVNNPGQRLMTGLSSTVDALLLSGGVAKTGSLRDVRIIRGGRQYNVDLYGVLTGGGGNANMRLADGDRLFVAPLGRTVAVAGLVRNPGIYELPAGHPSLPAETLVTLAGGREVSGNYLSSLLKLQPDGRTALVLASMATPVSDGEVLTLQLQVEQTIARATLSGGTALAGSYPILGGTKLSELIRHPGALGTSPYTLFGIISRRDPRTLMRSMTVFTPVAVLNGGEDVVLQPDDIVRPISVDEMRMLVTTIRDYDQWRSAQDEAIRNPLGAAPANNGASSPNGATQQGLPQNPGAANVAAQNGAAQNNLFGSAILNAANSSADAANSQKNVIDALAVRSSNRINVSGQAGAQVASQAPNTIPAPNFQIETTTPGNFEQNREVSTLQQLSQQLGVDPQVLINFLVGNQVTIDGALRGPGTYFVGPTVTLQDLVLAAGGTMNWTDTSGVELISTTVDPPGGRSISNVSKLPLTAATLASYIVKPRDAFRFNEIFTDVNVGSATLQGEVRFNGNYRLTRGERLSDLLARAGGLTNAAYPYGTVFLRRSAAAQEQDGYLRAAKEVEDQLVVAMTRVGNDKIDPSTFAAMQTFVAELRNQKALGRIAIAADPSVLAANPALDPLLEAGDVIYVPPRPSTIAVLGQVMQPANLPYQSGAGLADYVSRAGGYSRLADEGEVFVVLPDGTARKVEKTWFRFGSTTVLPPGSTIVVPRDVTPLETRQMIMDITQILSQLAISMASLAVLAKQ